MSDRLTMDGDEFDELVLSGCQFGIERMNNDHLSLWAIRDGKRLLMRIVSKKTIKVFIDENDLTPTGQEPKVSE